MQTIIIAIDFSEASLNAAKYAAALAKPLGVTHIVLYHSYDSVPVNTDIPDNDREAAFAHKGSLQALEIIERELSPFLRSNREVSIELEANDMPLVMGVEMLAAKHEAGLIVAGATGKSKLKQIFVGSNTVSLASDCKVPLLIVPNKAYFRPIEKIVFACDLKKVSHSTPVAEIGLWLERLQAKLLVLNVTPEGKRFNLDLIAEQHQLHHLLDRFQPEYHYIASDDIAEEIEDFAEDRNADLIISIPRSYGFLDGLFHRSVSRRLIKDSEVPLLMLREKT